ADLAESRGARVGRQGRAQVVLAGPRPGLNDLAVAEGQLDTVDVDARRRAAHREVHGAGCARLDRPGEDLAGGHVALAVGVDPRAAPDAEPEVGAIGFEMKLACLGQAR